MTEGLDAVPLSVGGIASATTFRRGGSGRRFAGYCPAIARY